MTMWQRRDDERGSTSTAEVVLIAPALLLCLMLIVQFGLVFHAKQMAEQAAQEGAAAARRFDASAGDGEAAAGRFLAAIGSGTLRGRSVKASRGAENVSVTVSGTVVSLVPGMKLRVSETAGGPVERYVPPEEQ